MTPREKAKGLIELALDETTTDDERASAAIKAAKLINKYDLLPEPKPKKNDAARVASEVFEKFTSPEFANTLDAAGRLVGTLGDRLEALRDMVPRKSGRRRR